MEELLSSNQLIVIITLLLLICLISIIALFLFGGKILGYSFLNLYSSSLCQKICQKDELSENEFRRLDTIFSEILEKRNDIWMSYSQVILAIVIIITLGILLLTHTISSEAGLPIISAISGFAISSFVSKGKQNRVLIKEDEPIIDKKKEH